MKKVLIALIVCVCVSIPALAVDIWYDVDTALSEVPINKFPLTDDTDFKSIEAAVVYNATGLALNWHFVTTAGAYTITAVTPTDTGGNYDWVDQGTAGTYTIEIPASGGASINNDTEGHGWFTGVATGVLPWVSPIFGFRAAGLNNVLIDSAYSTTRGLSGTALPDAAADAAGGIPISDAGGIDMDAWSAASSLSAQDVRDEINEAFDANMPTGFTASTGWANFSTVYDTDFSTGYDTTTNMWNVDLEYVGGTVYSSALQDEADTKAAVRFVLGSNITDVNNGSVVDSALDAKTAAEKIDTNTELRTLLAGSDTPLATASGVDTTITANASVAAILADTSAVDTTTEFRTMATGADTPVAKETSVVAVPGLSWDALMADHTVEGSVAWYLRKIFKEIP